MIYPGNRVYYEADKDDPWHYSWIAFNGLNAEMYIRRSGLCMDMPVLTCKNTDKIKEYFVQMTEGGGLQETRDLMLNGLLYLILSEMINESDLKDIRRIDNHYVQKAVGFIEVNYKEDIHISDISAHLCLERKYFSRIFKGKTGLTPQEFLLKFRMKKACVLMADSSVTIGETAVLVGYKDPFLFSRTFKKYNGISPTGYRKNLEIKRNILFITIT